MRFFGTTIRKPFMSCTSFSFMIYRSTKARSNANTTIQMVGEQSDGIQTLTPKQWKVDNDFQLFTCYCFQWGILTLPDEFIARSSSLEQSIDFALRNLINECIFSRISIWTSKWCFFVVLIFFFCIFHREPLRRVKIFLPLLSYFYCFEKKWTHEYLENAAKYEKLKQIDPIRWHKQQGEEVSAK